MKLQKPSYLPGIILFILAVIISLSVYKDYGISLDEPTQREMGFVSHDYIFHNDYTLDNYIERDHGVGFELPLIFIEKALRLEDSRDIYLMRHLATNLFFLLSGFCCYILAMRLFKNNFVACLGFIIYVFQPRIFAHSFFNTKDVPFLGMFLISLTLYQIASEENKMFWYLLLGLACGYTTSIRILSIILVGIVVVFFVIDIIVATAKKEKRLQSFIKLLCFLAGFCLALYISFPTLWHDPISSFINTYKSLSHFRWEGLVLLNGEQYIATHLPWFYLPMWFCITNPILWILSGFLAVILILANVLKNPLVYITNTRERNFILYIGCFILPVLSIIFLNSVIYDGWRHIFFIYAPFVLLALFCINKAYIFNRKACMLICSFQILLTGVFMIRSHPFQQVYFNFFISRKEEFIRKNYEFDYWGAASKQALEYIAAHDTSSKIVITGWSPAFTNIRMLPKKDRERFSGGNADEANYFVTGFRYHPDDFEYPNIFYNIKVLNSSIVRVYKLR